MKLNWKLDLSEEGTSKSHLPVLDGLRGVAIGLVLLHHFFGKAFAFCWIGVDLFFVLSGFLITRILLKSLRQDNYLRNFYARRTLRIFPLYYFVLIVVLILLPWAMPGLKQSIAYLLDHQVWYWTYMQNWLAVKEGWLPGKNIILSHFWSLAIEEQYYLFWPLLVLLLRGKKLLVGIIVLILASLSLRVSGVFANPGYYVATVCRLDGLLIGSLLALLVATRISFVKTVAKPLVIVSALAVIIALLIDPDPKYSNAFMHTWGYTLLALFFCGMIAIALQDGNTVLKRMLVVKPLAFLGKYSYGIYIYHFTVYWLLRDYLLEQGNTWFSHAVIAQLFTSFTCLGITLVLALGSYHLLELPFLRLKKYFGGH